MKDNARLLRDDFSDQHILMFTYGHKDKTESCIHCTKNVIVLPNLSLGLVFCLQYWLATCLWKLICNAEKLHASYAFWPQHLILGGRLPLDK